MQTLLYTLQAIPLWVQLTVIACLAHWLLWLTAPMYRNELVKASRAQLLALVILSAAPGINVLVLLFHILVHVHWDAMGVWLSKPAFQSKPDKPGD